MGQKENVVTLEYIERLQIKDNTVYNPIEAGIHVCRYFITRQLCSGKRILDISCGEGYGSYLMSTWGASEVVGVDIDATAVGNASAMFQRQGLSFIVSDAEDMSVLQDASFDMVVSLETIEHVPNPEIYLREIKRLTRPGGTIIISCPNDHFYYPEEYLSNPYHLRKYSWEEFNGLAESVLGPVACTYLGGSVIGFANLPIDILAADSGKEQSDMLSMTEGENAVRLPAGDKRLTKEDCSYFIHVWCSGKPPGVSLSWVPSGDWIKLQQQCATINRLYVDEIRRNETIRVQLDSMCNQLEFLSKANGSKSYRGKIRIKLHSFANRINRYPLLWKIIMPLRIIMRKVLH